MDPSFLSQLGTGAQISGAATSAIGSYYAALSRRYSLKAQALDDQFEASTSRINARSAAMDAQTTFEAGRREEARVGLTYRQLREATRTRQAASGVKGGVGSAAEVVASVNLAKEQDRIAMNANTVRAVNRLRMREVDFRNRASLADVRAKNAMRMARSINPTLSAVTSLMGSAGSVAREWAADERRSRRGPDYGDY